LAQRFRDYLSIILVGPVLIFSALGVMAGLLASELVSSVLQFAPLAQVIAAGSWAMPTVIIILAFTFFYFFIPNTKVRPRSALIGGIIAGLAWNGVGWAFATFVVSLPGYTQVYASFASPLIFLIWIYLSWTVLLIGASIGFYHQHAVNFPNYRGPLILGQQAREAAVLAVVRAIGGEFFNNRGGLGAAEISQRLGMPTYIADLALGWMEDAEFVTMTADHDPRYVPAKPWDKVNIHALLQSLRVGADDGAVRLAKLPADDQAAIEAIQQRYSAATEQSVGAMTLRQFATAPAANISSLSREAANSD